MNYTNIATASKKGLKKLAVLIDPDKTNKKSLELFASRLVENRVDYIFIGGSLMVRNYMDLYIRILKESTNIPVIIFPGNTLQINENADSILLLSLISGRNPELLIGNHVTAAPILRNSGLEIIPTGYMLIDSGKLTSVLYMSNTTPIPADKDDIAICTAMAGEMLGLKMIYLDAGSGAQSPVPENIISRVKENISIPLIVGGGIKNPETAIKAWNAGADMIVVGNALETQTNLIDEICFSRDTMNRIIA